MKSITETEFKNNIDLFIDEFLDQPIIITSPKRKSLVLISADEYQRLTKISEAFTTSQRIILESKILEGEGDIEAGRVKECSSDTLDQITQEVIAEKKQLSIGRKFMRKYFKTFKALSK